jgi:putative transposase
MAQSLSRVILHIVFSTKNHTPWLRDADIRQDLYAYQATVLSSIECNPILINGTMDHVHILCVLSRKIAIMDLVEKAKTTTSKWVKPKGPGFRDFHWQGGYGVFSVSESNVESVRAYIANQEAHHRKMTFQEEFREMCRRHNIPLNEEYAWQ